MFNLVAAIVASPFLMSQGMHDTGESKEITMIFAYQKRTIEAHKASLESAKDKCRTALDALETKTKGVCGGGL